MILDANAVLSRHDVDLGARPLDALRGGQVEEVYVLLSDLGGSARMANQLPTALGFKCEIAASRILPTGT